MNSGKSTALLQVAHNYEERDQNVLIAKPSVDTKGGQTIVSRLGVKRNVDIILPPSSNAYKIIYEHTVDAEREGKKIDCILVDEAQFLQPEQVNELFGVAVKLNIPVIAYGIRNDFQTEIFPGAARLMAIAHSLEELKNICRCGRKAVMNGRKTMAGEWITAGSQVAIDGEAVQYESLCGNCYINLVRDFTVAD